MALETECLPDAVNGGLAHAHLGGHRTRGPMGGVFGFLLQGFNDHCLDLVVGDLPWSTGPRVVGQPVHPILDEAPAPLADHRLAHSERFGHLPVGRASIGATHDDARSHGHCLRALAPVGQAFERLALLGAEHQLGLRPSSVSHSCLPSWLMMRGTRSGTGNSRNQDISSELRGRDTSNCGSKWRGVTDHWLRVHYPHELSNRSY